NRPTCRSSAAECWTSVASVTPPAGRYGAAMALDPLSHRLILFGGLSGTSTVNNDTWRLDTSGWTNITRTLKTSPPARYLSLIAADPLSGHLILFGGGTDSWTSFGDT